jgi:hypothetical protein
MKPDTYIHIMLIFQVFYVNYVSHIPNEIQASS